MFSKRDISREVESFYSFPSAVNEVEYCSGTACFVARELDPKRFSMATKQQSRTYCLGKCYEAPSSSEGRSVPRIEARTGTPIVLDNISSGPVTLLDTYRKRNGFKALQKALEMKPAEVVDEIDRSQLRGRGGAGFPTGKNGLRCCRRIPVKST